MNLLLLALVAPALVGSAALAQDAGVAVTPAALRHVALLQTIEERRQLFGNDEPTRLNYLAKNFADLAEFITEFPTAPEANDARHRMAGLATLLKDQPGTLALGRKALADYNPALASLRQNTNLIYTARALGGPDAAQELIQRIHDSGKSTAERMDFLVALKTGRATSGEELSDKLLADLQSSAKTDDDKATIQLGLADLAYQRGGLEKKDQYKAMLAEVAKQYPDTKDGKLAGNKLAAFDLKPGDELLHFSTLDLSGKPISTADYQGKVLLIEFWSTGCGPCIAELPNMLEVYTELHAQGFDILGVPLDPITGRKNLVTFIEKRQLPWRQAFEGKGYGSEAARLYNVESIPSLILVGKDGKVFATTHLRGKALKDQVKQALEAE